MRKNHATFQEQRDNNVDKAKPPPTFIYWCRNLKSKKTKGGCNITAGGGDCE
jgi:hypothetical protein